MTRDEAVQVLSSEEGRNETKRVYYLRVACDAAAQAIRDGELSRFEAERLVDQLQGFADRLFPDSQETFSIVYGRRFRRLIAETYGPTSA